MTAATADVSRQAAARMAYEVGASPAGPTPVRAARAGRVAQTLTTAMTVLVAATHRPIRPTRSAAPAQLPAQPAAATTVPISIQPASRPRRTVGDRPARITYRASKAAPVITCSPCQGKYHPDQAPPMAATPANA